MTPSLSHTALQMGPLLSPPGILVTLVVLALVLLVYLEPRLAVSIDSDRCRRCFVDSRRARLRPWNPLRLADSIPDLLKLRCGHGEHVRGFR